MKRKVRLTVAVIAQNEEKDLPACLRSARFADEVLVVDGGSSDRTLSIARRYADRVLQRRFDAYGRQKEFAIRNSRGRWVLNLDADERVSPELGREILQRLAEEDGAIAGYRIPFVFHFLGRRMRFSGWREKHLRLFRRDRVRIARSDLHEEFQVNGPVADLTHPVHHHSYPTLEEYLEKFNRYTTLSAQQKLRREPPLLRPIGGLWDIAGFPLRFLGRYLLKLGFLDGGPGFYWALFSSLYGTVRRGKMWTSS